MITDFLTEHIILENSRVKLIPFESERNKGLKNICFNDAIWQYMGFFIRSQTDLESYIKHTLKSKNDGASYPFLIIDKNSGQLAGSTRYGYINTDNEKCEIGWTWYGTKFQGTGLNKACKYELLRFGFEQIGFRRIQFSADKENMRSQKAIEKLGAQKEGVFRNNYIDDKGKSRHDVYYSIIQEDWYNLKQKHFHEFMQ